MGRRISFCTHELHTHCFFLEMAVHAQGDVAGGRYGSGPSIAVRKETLDSIKHPWI